MLQKLIDYDKILCKNAVCCLYGVALNAVTICFFFLLVVKRLKSIIILFAVDEDFKTN